MRILSKQRVFWIYHVPVHLLLITLLILLLHQFGLIERLQARFSGTIVEDTHLYDALLPYHQRMDGSVPQGSIVFIGDSIVQALATSAVADKTVNYGIGADTVAGLLARLPSYQSIKSARAVVLSIGVNDLWFRENDEIVSLYDQLLAAVPADIPVLVNAVFPVEQKYGFADGINERIKSLNQSLAKIASRHHNVTVVDLGQQLADARGELSPDYHIGDGLHLNTQGYQLWIEILREELTVVTELEID